MVYIELLIALVLILINGVLAMSELAVVSALRGRLKAMAEGGLAHSSSLTGKTPGHAPSVVEIMCATLGSHQGIHA